MLRPTRWRGLSASSWPGWGSLTPTWRVKGTMADPDPAQGAPPRRWGVLALLERWRRTSAQALEDVVEPPTAATGELLTQAPAFQDLRVDHVMKPPAAIVSVA